MWAGRGCQHAVRRHKPAVRGCQRAGTGSSRQLSGRNCEWTERNGGRAGWNRPLAHASRRAPLPPRNWTACDRECLAEACKLGAGGRKRNARTCNWRAGACNGHHGPCDLRDRTCDFDARDCECDTGDCQRDTWDCDCDTGVCECDDDQVSTRCDVVGVRVPALRKRPKAWPGQVCRTR